MAPFSYIYLFLVITVWKFGSVVHASVATSENFVRPSNFENKTCQFNPCLPLNDYAREADHYFVDNTIFAFLSGTHELDIILDLRSLSNITLIAYYGGKNVSLVFNPLVNMTWTNCINIQISDLNIVISGREIFPDTYIFATLVFNSTIGSLSRLIFCGNKSMSSTAVLMNESSIKITSLSVIGARSLQGAALHANSSTMDISGENVFINNHATNKGGAIALHDNSTCNMTGSISFINNTAMEGGAMAFDGGNHHIYGNVSFMDNFVVNERGTLNPILRCGQYGISGKVCFMNNSAKHGGAISVSSDRETSITLDDVAFIGNNAIEYGGAIDLSKGEHSVTGNISFVNNFAGKYGGAITVFNSSHACTITGNISFENNMSKENGGAVAFINGCHMSGTILFVNNQALIFGGAVFLGNISDSNNNSHRMVGRILFADNSATTGGAIYSSHTGPCNIFGNVSFVNNTANYLYSEAGLDQLGGAIAVYSSDVELVGNVSFQENSADSGGAIYMDSGVIIISGMQHFVRNFAEYGGALAFSGTSKLILSKPLTVHFIENEAKNHGGAIYVIDSCYNYQCSDPTTFYHWPECFVELRDYNADDIHLNFINNTAGQTGRILYGGSVDRCKLYKEGGIFDNCGNRRGGYYDYGLLPKFQTITNTTSVDKNIPDISSDPLEVCFCDENDTVPIIKCEDPKVEVMRGREFTLKAITLGQSGGSIPSDVRIILSNGIKINEMQHVQSTTNECSPIRFRLFSAEKSAIVVLFPADSPCRDTGRSHREIKVSFVPCPDAFYLKGDECICDERLHDYTTNCSVNDNSIIRSSKMFWMGVDYYNNSTTFKGLILHNGSCPFDYCVEPDMQDQLSITLDNLDIQCNHNHAGTLCGCCKENHSVVFSTIHCLPCSNAYLALILPFAFAGIALIMVLILLKLSIANGTLNALIFYANIIQANRSIFFPLGETNPLTIFVAWLNLDLGVETCFYDGMTVYGFTWLQFVFPFYIWFLIGLIIIVTHYSQRATNMLGTNPVAALATLLLLSYSKLLRAVIMALSMTHLEYPGHIYKNKKVWLYDGSMPYFQRADHIVLGIFAILVLLLLFVPYTLLLLCGHLFQAYSQRKPFSWINKLMPFLDAYHAPYKKETRYWTGFLLVVRCTLLLIFGLNAFGNANDNLLAITIFTACLLILISLHKGIYKTTYNNILEMCFILNLCIFSATTYQIQGNQAGIAYSFVGVAFSIFLLIILLHAYLALSKTSLGKRLPSLSENFVAQHLLGAEVNHLRRDEQRPEHDHMAIGRQGEQRNLANRAPTTSFIDIREYEPLLDSR